MTVTLSAEAEDVYPAGTARGIQAAVDETKQRHVRWLSSNRSRLTATG